MQPGILQTKFESYPHLKSGWTNGHIEIGSTRWGKPAVSGQTIIVLSQSFDWDSDACVCVHNDLVRAVDNKEVTALVLFDLSSAFDTVDHSTLLTVLHRRFGVEESAMDWFTSYLSDSTQTFRLNDEMSSSIPLTCSVPQKSVPGLILFISYTHDVPLVFQRHQVNYHLYADDKQAYGSVYTREWRYIGTHCPAALH